MATNSDNIPAEEWRDIPEFEGIYQVNRLGEVRALDRYGKDGRFLPARRLKPNSNRLGYKHLCLPWKGGYRSLSLHKAVMTAFVGPRPDGMHICHNNGDPTDNRLDNLRYDTPKGNEADKAIHGTRDRAKGDACSFAKITEQEAREIIALNGEMSQYEIAQRYGISRSQVAKILYGIRWPHLGGVRKVKRVYMRGEAHKAAHAAANEAKRRPKRDDVEHNRHKGQ